MARIPRLLLIIDGMGERPVFELDHKTPLQAANLPAINQLAQEGQCGTADPVKPGIVASTFSGTLAILGYDPLEKTVARGVVEALGCGMKIDISDVAFRGNWATLDEKGLIVDRRAGRIREWINELALSITGQKIDMFALMLQQVRNTVSLWLCEGQDFKTVFQEVTLVTTSIQV